MRGSEERRDEGEAESEERERGGAKRGGKVWRVGKERGKGVEGERVGGVEKDCEE